MWVFNVVSDVRRQRPWGWTDIAEIRLPYGTVRRVDSKTINGEVEPEAESFIEV